MAEMAVAVGAHDLSAKGTQAAVLQLDERAYEIVDKYARAPEVQKECLARVGRATEMRWLFTDGIYRTFVEGGANGH